MDEESSANYDQALAKAIASSDPDAVHALFDRFSTWTYRFAYYHLGKNSSDAEDLCSDILIAAMRSIDTSDVTRGSLDAWVLGVARHRLSRFCRRRHWDLPLSPEIVASDSSQDTGVVNELENTVLMRDVVNRTLASLLERQAKALTGKYVDGYSTEELACLMEATPSAVESLLVRARNAFRAAVNAIKGGDENA
ncbi:MAG: hypothetical protein A2Z18_00010 [Armatimonadetes bacterium RBG_16_58_9]|nr:MAG: hypothetical protein A2Z18_00010 [Armatimonadetes bacterium RBG_16_58_9]